MIKIILLLTAVVFVIGCTGVQAPNDVVEPAVSLLCSDTDGIDPSVRGKCHDKYYMVEDKCTSLGMKVKEYYCDGDFCETQIIDCVDGCDNGKCIVGCSDTDGGIDIHKKGIVTFKDNNYPDACHSTGKRIMEYYCMGGIKYVEDKACSIYEHCVDGACIKK